MLNVVPGKDSLLYRHTLLTYVDLKGLLTDVIVLPVDAGCEEIHR